MIKILIACTSWLRCKSMSAILQQQIEDCVVETASRPDLEDAKQKMQHEKYDLIIIEVLPDTYGERAAQSVRADYAQKFFYEIKQKVLIILREEEYRRRETPFLDTKFSKPFEEKLLLTVRYLLATPYEQLRPTGWSWLSKVAVAVVTVAILYLGWIIISWFLPDRFRRQGGHGDQ